MYSTVGIFNLALARIGGGQLGRVNSPDEDSTSAVLCRGLWPHVVGLSLAAHPWSFAIKREALAEKPPASGDAGSAAYPYRYGLPGDCVRPLRLVENGAGYGAGHGAGDGRAAFVLEGGDLLTAANPAVLVFVADRGDPSNWPPAFADAVAWLLAAELATSHLNDPRRQQFYMQQYEAALLKARAGDLNSQEPIGTPSPWLDARE